MKKEIFKFVQVKSKWEYYKDIRVLLSGLEITVL